MAPKWHGNTKPPFVDLFRWFESVESGKGGNQIDTQGLGYRDASHMFRNLLENRKDSRTRSKTMWTTTTKTCSIVHLKHPTFTFRAPRFSAARCSAVRCRSPVQRDRSARFFNNLVLSMGRRLRRFYESLVSCGNPFYNKIMHPSLFKTNHLHIEKNPLKAGIRPAISSQYPPVEFEINERGTPAKVFQQGAEKKLSILLRTFPPFKSTPVFSMVSSTSFPPGDGLHAVERSFIIFCEVSVQNRHVFWHRTWIYHYITIT